MQLRKRILKGLLALTMLFSGFALTACMDSVSIKGIHMSNTERIDVPYGNFSYDGINVTVDYSDGSSKEIPLVEDMVNEVERLKFFKMGNQTVNVVYRTRYKTEMPINVVLNQFKDTYALVGYECVYDGLPHSVNLNQELPEGATISYPYGNVFTNAGTYEVVGVMAKDGYESKRLSATLTIKQADKDASGIVFRDATVTYTGEIQTLVATNVPEGVDVTYNYYIYDTTIPTTVMKNVGKYTVVAHFNDESPNYTKIPDKTAVLTIEKANYDISGIGLASVVKEYDGQEYEAKVIGGGNLPSGIKPKDPVYRNPDGKIVASNAPVGEYTITVDFSGQDLINYNPIEPLTATLTVTKRIIRIADKVILQGKTVNFDENVTQSLEISGTLPTTVEVTYENNNKVYAGEYIVTANFKATNPNETVDVEKLTAYLIINFVRRAVKVYNDVTEQYDKDFSADNISVNNGEIIVSGYDESVYTVTSKNFYDILNNELVDPAHLVDHTTYKYVIQFKYLDENMNTSVVIPDESDNYTYIEA